MIDNTIGEKYESLFKRESQPAILIFLKHFCYEIPSFEVE